MGYWAAFKNRKGKFQNYLCSECHRVAPINKKRQSILTKTCPFCNREMLFVGLIPYTKYIKVED
jgi:NAD-dependent SIR2 family protein deacetylase